MTSTEAQPKDIAPEIFRQRLLIEGFFDREIDEAVVRDYLLGLAAELELRTYGEPMVFAPGDGTGKAENAGFDAFDHYYRPEGRPRDQQPWLASLWRRPA